MGDLRVCEFLRNRCDQLSGIYDGLSCKRVIKAMSSVIVRQRPDLSSAYYVTEHRLSINPSVGLMSMSNSITE